MVSLYLVRHAETEAMAGISERDNLTLRGRKQAAALGRRLSRIQFNAIYVSDKHRAKETAGFIRNKARTIITRQLREICRTLVGSEPKPGTPKKRRREDLARIERLCKRFLKPGPRKVLLVCHGNVIRYFIAKALDIDPKKMRKVWIAPTSVTFIAFKRKSPGVVYVNDTAHLPKKIAKGPDFPELKFA